jgi:hypothetical protein
VVFGRFTGNKTYKIFPEVELNVSEITSVSLIRRYCVKIRGIEVPETLKFLVGKITSLLSPPRHVITMS